jgi:hypothetical protein
LGAGQRADARLVCAANARRPAEWGEIFADEVMAAALIDRLLHHCHIVNIRGNSYRMRRHADLWHQLHPLPEGDSASAAPAA